MVAKSSATAVIHEVLKIKADFVVSQMRDPERRTAVSCIKVLYGLAVSRPGFLRPDSRSLRGTYHTCAQAATVLA